MTIFLFTKVENAGREARGFFNVIIKYQDLKVTESFSDAACTL